MDVHDVEVGAFVAGHHAVNVSEAAIHEAAPGWIEELPALAGEGVLVGQRSAHDRHDARARMCVPSRRLVGLEAGVLNRDIRTVSLRRPHECFRRDVGDPVVVGEHAERDRRRVDLHCLLRVRRPRLPR
jgi:hypothetical protein